MKSIVLAEKPSVGRDIGRVLGCSKKTRGYLEGREYIVTWAMGHLVELADPGEYDERFKTWALDYLPMLPDRMRHKVIRRTSGQFRTIKGLFRRKDVKELVVATDAGREGELVARWIMRLGGWKGSFSRLWISSQTDKAVRDGFGKLKQGRDYDNLFRAAECRAEADWIIGINVTRALTCKHDARLSAGRVQTPTLAMIVQRQREIANFTPEAYWTIHADFGPFSGTWIGPKGLTRLKDQKRASAITEKITGKEAVVASVVRKEKSEAPPLAYDLTTLQREANAQLGFSAKKTLSTLQGLYERHKIVTYPRTDSRYITTDMVPTIEARLKAIQDSPYRKVIGQLLSTTLNTNRLVNDRRVTDHHAIIPTEQTLNLRNLSGDEKALWNLIVRRFLATMMAPYRYESITLTLQVEGENFTARGIRVIERGWREAGESTETEDDEQGQFDGETELWSRNLANFKEGARLTVKKAEERQGFTKPPPLYTEGTLLAAMENAGKFIEDKQLKESIAGSGIGTPATRADIIEKLLGKYYIERRGKDLLPTDRGQELLDLAPEELQSPELTARWEQRLSRIAQGEENAQGFSTDVRKNAEELITKIKRSDQKYNPRNTGGKQCPMCGKNMLSARDKTGKKLLVCPSFACSYEEREDVGYEMSRRPSRKEQARSRHLIRQYSDSSKDTVTFADLIKASQDKRDKGKKERDR